MECVKPVKSIAWRRSQGGFALISALILMTVGVLAAAYEIQRQFDEAQIGKAETQGELLGGPLNNAIGTYLTTYYTQLVNNQAIPGVANVYAPSINELRNLGMLDSSFSATNMYGGAYGISVSRIPTGCTPPACDLTSLVWIDAPIRDHTGQANVSYAASAASKIGANGAFSTYDTPATLSGAGGSWTAANPVTGTNPNRRAVVAARNGYGAQGFSELYRRDGSLPLTADLNLGNYRITGLQSVTSGSACSSTGDLARSSSGVVLSCQGGTWKEQKSAYWEDPVHVSVAMPACNAANANEVRVRYGYASAPTSRALICNGSSWIGVGVDGAGNMTVPGTVTAGALSVSGATTLTGNVTTGNNLTVASNIVTSNVTASGRVTANTLHPQLVATANTACSPNGLIAQTSTGQLLSCTSGTWEKYVQPNTYTNGSVLTTGNSTWTLNLGGCGSGGYASGICIYQEGGDGKTIQNISWSLPSKPTVCPLLTKGVVLVDYGADGCP